MESHDFHAIFFWSAKEYKEYAQVWIWSSSKNLRSRGYFGGKSRGFPKLMPCSIIQNPLTFRGPWHRGGGCPSCCCIATSRSRQGAAGAYAEAAGFAQYTREAVPGQMGMSRKCLDYFGLKRSRPMCDKLDFGKPGSHQTYHPNDFASTMPP